MNTLNVSAPIKVVVFQWPCGTPILSRSVVAPCRLLHDELVQREVR